MPDRAADVSSQTPSPWKQMGAGMLQPYRCPRIGSGPVFVGSESSPQVRVERALDVGHMLELSYATRNPLPFQRIAAHKKTGGGHGEGRVCI
jgi:hypothetical protein